MNSERRHELQENDLAAYLARINQVIEPYSKLIAVAIGAVAIGGIGLALYQSKASGDRSDATLALIQASTIQDPSELSQIAASYPDTAAAAWAKLYEGNTLLGEAIQALFVDRPAAEESIGQASDAFRAAISMSDDRVVQSRSHFGLARAAETLGQIDTAIDEYKKTADANESTSMVQLAQRRIETLENPDTEEFVKWFAEQDFSPADPSLPPSLPSGSTLSDVPDVTLPALDAGLTTEDGSEVKELSDGGLEMPADGKSADSKPADGKSADGKSAEEQPADDAAKTSESESSDAAASETTDSTKTESGDSAASEDASDTDKDDSDAVSADE